jgi:hypothetical protein
MEFSSAIQVGRNRFTPKRVRLGFVSAISIVLAFLWVLLAPIFSYEPSSSDIDVPPGTELAESGIQILEYSSKES